MNEKIYKILDYYIPDTKCELDYNKDYELLIATVLSAQCTDKRVNKITPYLFKNYSLETLAKVDLKIIQNIIKSCGSYTKKAKYIQNIAKNLLKDYNGIVPNNRIYLENLPGVGRKTCNVVLKNLFDEPCFPVDTHVMRVSKRLGLALEKDNPLIIEKKLMNLIPQEKWNKIGDQILLFGRYHCKSINPNCQECLFKDNICQIHK